MARIGRTDTTFFIPKTPNIGDASIALAER
jgi:hypothetical protein